MFHRLVLICCLCFLAFQLNAQPDLMFSPINSVDGLSDNQVRNIVQLKDGRMVITTHDGTTNLYNGTTFKILHQKTKTGSPLSGYWGFLHSYADNDYVWIKNTGSVKLIDVARERFVPRPDSVLQDIGFSEAAADFFMDVNKGYWIRTVTDKLMYRAFGSEKPMEFGSNVSKPFGEEETLLDLAVVGSQVFLVYRSGLMICYDVPTRKLLYKTNSLTSAERIIYDFTLMVAQSDRHLYMVRNGKAGIMQQFDTKSQRWSTILKTDYWLSTVSVDVNQNVWVSCARGLWWMNRKTEVSRLYSSFKMVDGTDVTTEANTLYNDSQGGLWLGTFNHGLLYYHPDRFKFRYYGKSLFGSFKTDFNVNSFKAVSKDKILVGTSIGLYEFNPVSGVLKPSTAKTSPSAQRPNSNYTCTLKDRRGFVWMGTPDGLLVQRANQLQTLYKEDGLVNNCIKGMLEDKEGDLWVSTSGGVSRIRVSADGNFLISNFNQYDGVIKNEFIANAIYKTEDDLLYIGGVNEFNVLDLNRKWVLLKLQKPLFTDFTVFGKSIETERSITATERIELNYRQNAISIRFSALNFVNPTQTYYQYRMKGVDDQWHASYEASGAGSASYTNLAPGTYVFEAKAANNSNEWSDEVAQMTIVIRPPFWKTPWAYLVYTVLAVLLVNLVFSTVRRKTQQRLAKKNEAQLNELKFKFFTNISHEFRTPLTLIITPLESILQELKGSATEQKVRSVYKHAQDLMQLVNQLLDFRRLELGGEKLQLTYGNTTEFLEQFQPLFEKLAQLRKIDFVVEAKEEELFLFFDQAKLYKVINNLLSNAFKFTPEGGSVSLVSYRKGDVVCIEVVDSGVGIPASELPLLFNRYFQGANAKEGSGIGLHLVKEYVELHQGSVWVESEPSVKTMFRLELPMNLEPAASEVGLPQGALMPQEASVQAETLACKILVVEDNAELRTFLVSELRKTYQVLDAADGAQAEKIALAELPDLIVSDVMMPVMDGLELCKRIKSDVRTSHIPLILLTAKASEEHKLSGFQCGADEYLAKPFSMELLQLRIRQLIELREKRKHSFTGKIEVNPAEITISSLDEQLLQRALDCMEINMGNADYSVQQFSLDLGMDRTVLYKKLHSLTGLPPSEFIRSIRLKRAAQILLQGRFPIAEVSEMVGFNTQKYFTKYFKEAFGVLPSQYAQQKRG